MLSCPLWEGWGGWPRADQEPWEEGAAVRAQQVRSHVSLCTFPCSDHSSTFTGPARLSPPCLCWLTGIHPEPHGGT